MLVPAIATVLRKRERKKKKCPGRAQINYPTVLRVPHLRGEREEGGGRVTRGLISSYLSPVFGLVQKRRGGRGREDARGTAIWCSPMPLRKGGKKEKEKKEGASARRSSGSCLTLFLRKRRRESAREKARSISASRTERGKKGSFPVPFRAFFLLSGKREKDPTQSTHHLNFGEHVNREEEGGRKEKGNLANSAYPSFVLVFSKEKGGKREKRRNARCTVIRSALPLPSLTITTRKGKKKGRTTTSAMNRSCGGATLDTFSQGEGGGKKKKRTPRVFFSISEQRGRGGRSIETVGAIEESAKANSALGGGGKGNAEGGQFFQS